MYCTRFIGYIIIVEVTTFHTRAICFRIYRVNKRCIRAELKKEISKKSFY